MDLAELNRVANFLVTPGKGVLAADESAGTVKKRFDELGMAPVGNTPAEFAKAMKEETARWASVVQARKLQID